MTVSVTCQHGVIFALEWCEQSLETLLSDVFAKTGVLEWPEEERAQMRYHEIARTIVERTFAAARPAIVEAFVVAASEVLATDGAVREPTHSPRYRDGVDVRQPALPFMVLTDAKMNESRCINGLHVETFIPNPFGEGTLITFANGDRVTVTEDFDTVVDALMGDRVDG